MIVTLILALVWALASTTRVLTSEKSSSMLASIRSMASGLTSIILIVVVIIRIIISVLFCLYFYWRGFRLLLWLFAFSSASSFSLLWSGPFKRLGNICFFFIILMSYKGIQARNCCALCQVRQCSCWWITFCDYVF